jgi:hypothetical protein
MFWLTGFSDYYNVCLSSQFSAGRTEDLNMTRKYYSAESDHGSESSYGFANDTTVKVWSSRSARDAYVRASSNISCQPILRDQATKYATNANLSQGGTNAPTPFSGKHWVIDPSDDDPEIGLIGVVECGSVRCDLESFYK